MITQPASTSISKSLLDKPCLFAACPPMKISRSYSTVLPLIFQTLPKSFACHRQLTVMNTPDEYASLVFDIYGQDAEWARSAWDYTDPIDAGPDKVHFRVQFPRYLSDGSAIGMYKSLYIVSIKHHHFDSQG